MIRSNQRMVLIITQMLRPVFTLCIILFICITAYGQQVAIINDDESWEPQGQLLGEISAVDRGFKTRCTYRLTLDEAIEKVEKAGGNLLRITRWKEPSPGGSTCYQLWGQAYHIDDRDAAMRSVKRIGDTVTAQLIPQDAQYAMLYVYRPSYAKGFLARYTVNLDNDQLIKVHNNSYDTFRVLKQGPVTLWARLQNRVELPVNIKFGKAYFLRCEIYMGGTNGIPVMTLVPPNQGYKQYTIIKDR